MEKLQKFNLISKHYRRIGKSLNVHFTAPTCTTTGQGCIIETIPNPNFDYDVTKEYFLEVEVTDTNMGYTDKANLTVEIIRVNKAPEFTVTGPLTATMPEEEVTYISLYINQNCLSCDIYIFLFTQVLENGLFLKLYVSISKTRALVPVEIHVFHINESCF